MTSDSVESQNLEGKVLIFAPNNKERELIGRALDAAGVSGEICADVTDLSRGLGEEEVVVAVITETGLVAPEIRRLTEALGAQSDWSDLPIVVVGTRGNDDEQELHAQCGRVFGTDPNVALIESPFRPATLVSAVKVALRSRRRQYEMRTLMERLRASEERVQNVLDSISDAFAAIDRDWRFIYVNASYMTLVSPLYKSADELMGEVVWEKFPDIANRDVGQFYQRMMEATEPETFEIFYGPLDAWLSIRAFPSPTGLSLYVRNITESKRRELEVEALHRKLQEQARTFDATLSNVVDLVYSFDRQGRVIYANRALLEIWGRSLEDAVGKNVYDLDYPPDLADRLHNELIEVAATGKPIRGEVVLRAASGEDDIHDYIFNPVFDDSGEVSAVVGTTRLVTEHRKAESAMRRLAAIVQFSDDAIVSKSLDGTIMSWNVGAERLFGFTPEEIIGKNVLTLIPPDRHHEEPQILARIFRGELIEHFETERVRKDGSRVTVSLTVSPIKDAEGRVVGASKIARDITEQKRIERDLEDAKNAAEAASRSKDHFLAVLSHELRTPLTPVLMTASALEMDPTVPANLRTDMAMIRRNIELETKLIDDLLDLSRITLGKLALHLRGVDVNESVRQVYSICEPEATAKGVRVEIDLEDGASMVRADPSRLQQVLWNLLKNAVKFTPEGGLITVQARREEGRRVRITVRDSGVGIRPEALPKIFDAFEQGDSRVTRQFGGLGLGLAITRALVGLHEGTITAESPGPGQGSTFTVCLPLGAETRSAEGEHPTERKPDGSYRLLIVEDHPDTATMLAKLLKGLGYDVTVANTAASGLEMAVAQKFDVVVSDLGLPDMSGYEFMQQLRQTREIKGIAMSGYGMEDDIRRSLEAGFSEHLVKPVSLSSLEQAIRRIVNR